MGEERPEGVAPPTPSDKVAPPTAAAEPGRSAFPAAAGPPPAAPPPAPRPSTEPPPDRPGGYVGPQPPTEPPSDTPGPRIEPPASDPRPGGYVGSEPSATDPPPGGYVGPQPPTEPPSDTPGPRIEPPASDPRPGGYVGSEPSATDSPPGGYLGPQPPTDPSSDTPGPRIEPPASDPRPGGCVGSEPSVTDPPPGGYLGPQPPTDPPSDPRIEPPATGPRPRGYVGSRPPTYDAEPTALPVADPDDLDDLVADTVLDGARYGTCTLRAVSVRGDSARYRGEPRRDSLLTARFGTGEHALLLVAMATGARATPGAHRAAAEACHWIGRAVGRSHSRLVEDIRAGRRGDLKSGLHRLTDRSLGKLRASAAEQGVDPEEYAAGLRCLLLPADPECRTRVFFGVGPGGLFRLREGEWQDIEPQVTDIKGEPVLGFGSPPSETPEGDRLTMDLGIPTPPSPYEPAPEPPREPFRFRTSVARPGDTLLMCSSGLADPLRGEPELCEYLADRWSRPEPPGLAAFLADSQVRVKGYADDRTAAAVWEA
ncbi:protein phosphatase 2C domain-containing protein [Streptomyces sp. NPDC000877]|uniref:protein phosphatase 2C domain-containing protein n=1 Tax=unclassified Streptomyces TaxID=2593676 RepID=UPI003322BA6B